MTHRRSGTTEGDVLRLGPGGALPAVPGGGLTGLTCSEYFLYLSGDQAYGSIALGGKVNFAVVSPAGGGVTVSSGTITLPTNAKCFLYFCGGMKGASADTDWSSWQWYDVTGGGAVALGNVGTGGAPRATTSYTAAGVAGAYLATTTARQVEVRRVVAGGVTPGIESSTTVAYIRTYS